jgi:hypothetical protein
MDGRIPDIVMWKGSRKLLAEVVVTHDLTEEKMQWIRENDLPTIRVNLSWVGYNVNRNVLAKCLRDGRAVHVTPRFNIVSWAHHPWLAAAQLRVNDQYLGSMQGPTPDRNVAGIASVG